MSILSIQSHVAYGHVGNAAAVFPLQRLGFEVWPVHSLQFSNHLGYPDWRGEVFGADHVRGVVEGIERRGAFAHCAAVLTGYMGDAALGEAMLDAVGRVRAANPAALFTCDPVMGDTDGGLYVGDAVAAAMREAVVPAADLITPNQFELEQLTGRAIATLEDAVAAVRAAIALGPEVVLITSLRHDATPADSIEMLAATAGAAYRVRTPYLALDPMPHGAGDAVAALFLAHCLKAGARRGTLEAAIGPALGEAAAAIFAIMTASQRAADGAMPGELALIAGQDQIADPSHRFPVERL